MALRTSRRPRRAVGAVLAALSVGVGLLSGCTSSGSSTAPSASPTPSLPPYSRHPNIVYLLTDDLSMNLVQYMPHVRALASQGMTFTKFSVTDSLCCPSRSSILTGRYPHNTGVFTNIAPDGGLLAFNRGGGQKSSYGYVLQKSGYRTALLGKYLNNYQVGKRVGDLPANYVPPGWSEWAVGAGAYKNFGYSLNQNGTRHYYGTQPKDYLTRVIGGLGNGFIRRSVAARTPFTLELATYSPHAPYVPDPMDAGSFVDLKAPRPPSFGHPPRNAASWMAKYTKRFTASKIAGLDAAFRKRVESVQSVDRALGSVMEMLRSTGQLSNTYIVFNSDNGLHLGEHALLAGKRTAFDTDVHVPLVVAGPGIAAGSTSDAMVQNIDIAPTFEDIAGLPPRADADGRSFLPLLHGQREAWRTRALVEHHGYGNKPGDPDNQKPGAGFPPTYQSLRGPTWTYTRYNNGNLEYFDRAKDPYETDNVAGSLTPTQLRTLNAQLDLMVKCKGYTQCWTAGRPG